MAAGVALCAPNAYAQCWGSRCASSVRSASYASFQSYSRYYVAPTFVSYGACETSTPAPCESVVETAQPYEPVAIPEPTPCEPVNTTCDPCAPAETLVPSTEKVEATIKVLDECQTGACPLRTVTKAAVKTATAPARAVASLLDVANRTRARYGLPAFQYDAALTAGAQRQANYCASIGDLRHGGGAAEILAQSPQGLEDAINQWLRSPGHRAMLLNGGYRYAGVSVVRDRYGRCWCAMRFR